MNFKDIPTICLGDLNSRFGTPPPLLPNVSYKPNPDVICNTNGKRLLEILSQINSFHILNGLQCFPLKADSDFTFYRGKSRSQNDVVLSNCIEYIKSFNILEKRIYSDHKPCSVEIRKNSKTSLDIVKRCSENTFSYNHYDINRRLVPPIKFSRVDVTGAIKDLEKLANEISVSPSKQLSN